MNRAAFTVPLVATLALVGLGVLFADPVLLTAAVIPLIYALYGSFARVPAAPSLQATRQFDATGYAPGQTVTVTLTVENTGSTVHPDVRIVDTVPDELAVTAGSPRTGRPLSPGDIVSLQYTIVLKQGRYEFDDPVARVRSFAGTAQQTVTVETRGDSAISCATTISDPPVSDATVQHAGTVASESSGSGLEFHATRQYHHGDPMNRINWHQVAKTGEFVTVQYRREQAAKSVIVVDCRPCTRVTYQAGYPTGAALSAYAGERLAAALDDAGVSTSITAVGLGEELAHLTEPDGLPWIHAGSATTPATLFRGIHQVTAQNPASVSLGDAIRSPDPGNGQAGAVATEACADGGSGDRIGTDEGTNSTVPPDEYGESTNTQEKSPESRSEWTEKLLSRLPADAQVVLCTPLLDDWPVELIQELTVREYSCTVLTPDVTPGPSAGQRIGGLRRRHRLRTLSETPARTADWRIDQPIEAVLLAAFPEGFDQ